MGFLAKLDGCWVEEKRREVWLVGPLCLFLSVWEARNGVAFRGEIFTTQGLKISFVSLLWAETKLSIMNGPSTLLEFID